MGIHNYLRSIGFKYLKKTEEMKKLIQSIIDQPDEKLITEDEMGNLFVELKKEYGDIIGIAVCGTYIDDKDFEMANKVNMGDTLRRKLSNNFHLSTEEMGFSALSPRSFLTQDLSQGRSCQSPRIQR